MNAEERAREIVEELSYMLHEYCVDWPFEVPPQEDDESMSIFVKHIGAAQREAIEKPKKQLQKCADWLMTAQGYLMAGIRDQLKECEDETRALIKQLDRV